MTIDPKLMKAILAMDSYNRGYNQGIAGLGSLATKIGNYTIIQQSDTVEGSEGVSDNFYAIAYEYNGQVVISYRGTDNPFLDFISGDNVHFGNFGAPQSELAFEFYEAVDAAAEFWGHNT